MVMSTNVESLGQYKIRFSLIVEQILAFHSSTKLVRKVKNLSKQFKGII